MSETKLIIDGARLDEVLRSPAGIIGVWLIERCQVVQTAARHQAPEKTGCLKGSIVKRFEETATGLQMRIQSDTAPCDPRHESYGLYVHEGTGPHNIPGAFGIPAPFGVGGRFDGMFHPGHPQPNRFLSDNLPLVLQ